MFLNFLIVKYHLEYLQFCNNHHLKNFIFNFFFSSLKIYIKRQRLLIIINISILKYIIYYILYIF